MQAGMFVEGVSEVSKVQIENRNWIDRFGNIDEECCAFGRDKCCSLSEKTF